MGRRIRALLVLALVALVIGGAPAQASSDSEIDQCDDGSVFSSMSPDDLPEMARGEGNFPREPELNATYEELPSDAVGKGKNGTRS